MGNASSCLYKKRAQILLVGILPVNGWYPVTGSSGELHQLAPPRWFHTFGRDFATFSTGQLIATWIHNKTQSSSTTCSVESANASKAWSSCGTSRIIKEGIWHQPIILRRVMFLPICCGWEVFRICRTKMHNASLRSFSGKNENNIKPKIPTGQKLGFIVSKNWGSWNTTNQTTIEISRVIYRMK